MITSCDITQKNAIPLNQAWRNSVFKKKRIGQKTALSNFLSTSLRKHELTGSKGLPFASQSFFQDTPSNIFIVTQIKDSDHLKAREGSCCCKKKWREKKPLNDNRKNESFLKGYGHIFLTEASFFCSGRVSFSKTNSANCPYCFVSSKVNCCTPSFCVNHGIPAPNKTGAIWR